MSIDESGGKDVLVRVKLSAPDVQIVLGEIERWFNDGVIAH
jgi:hypothetical protein